MDRQEIEFFGKFILCSNNEDNFLIIDPDETRYWIRKIPVLIADDPHLLATLREEIPMLIHYLTARKMTTTNQTRMWFSPDQIFTPALKKVIRQNRLKLEVELAGVLLSIADDRELKEIRFCIGDVQGWLSRRGIRSPDTTSIRRVLQNVWNLKPASNSNAYMQYKFSVEGNIYEQASKGRFYTLDVDAILKLNDC